MKGVIAPQINHILSTSSPYAGAALPRQSRFLYFLSCCSVTAVTKQNKNDSYLRKFIEKRNFLCYTPNRYKKSITEYIDIKIK